PLLRPPGAADAARRGLGGGRRGVSRYVDHEKHVRGPRAPLGPAWKDAVTALNRALWRLEPPARAAVRLDCGGLPEVLVYDCERRRETKSLCDALEASLARTCEHCGSPGALCAGPCVTVRCDDCRA